MSHMTVYMGISANKLKGAFDQDKISELVDEVMQKYLVETAEEKNIKCDWYVIGGRWEGSIAAVKGSENVLETESGMFPYQFIDQYDVIVNNGNRGPYFAGSTEYVPANGGLKKEIDWEGIAKLQEFMYFKYQELILNRDPRFGGRIPDGHVIKEDGLYVDNEGELVLLLKKGESFEERAVRTGETYSRSIGIPDAYIDTQGVWHDENEVWDAMMRGKLKGVKGNTQEFAQQTYMKNFTKFMDGELQDNDCFVVLDCHM